MIRSCFSFFLALLLLESVLCLPSTSKRDERRPRRQASRIPYASLSTGAIPARLRNLIRGRRPSSSSESSSSSGRDDSSTSGRTSGSSPTRHGANPYGDGASSYQFGSFGGHARQNGQAGSNDGGVPLGTHSTYPFGTSQHTSSQNFQTPYSNQPPPGSASYRGRSSSSYQPQRFQQPVNPYPSYGVAGGRGGMAGYGGAPPYGAYGANPYGGYGMVGGVVPQVPYANPYGLAQGGHYGGGYTASGGYADTSRRTTIGSPYRDPNSRFTSWVHPQGETSNTYGAGGYSYGRTGSTRGGSHYGSSSYGGSSDRYGSSSSQGRYSQPIPFASSGSQDGHVQQNPYGSPTSSGRYAQADNSRYYGGVSSNRGYGNADSSTGGYGSSSGLGGRQSAPESDSAYTSGGSYGFGDGAGPHQSSNEAGTYDSNGASATSGSFGTNTNPYGNRASSGASYGYGGVENQYGQTSGSRYGSSSGSRYNNVGQSRDDQQHGSNGLQSVGGSLGSPERTSGRQSSQYYASEPSGVPDSGAFSSSSSRHYSNNGASGISSSLGTAGQPSRNRGRFINPGRTSQNENESPSFQPRADQTGRFFSPEGAVGGSQGTIAPESATSFGPIPQSQADSNEESASLPSDETREEISRENYDNQGGTFLIPRRRRPNPHVTGGNNGTADGQRGRKMHASLRKCQRQDDGLPDLYLDYKRMRTSVGMYQMPVSNLSCAMSKDADCLSKSAYGPDRITLRKLLRFNTIAHNIGTADFLPNLRRRDWIFHPCHQHWHSMKEFAHFHLIDDKGVVVGEGHKVSFCLQDSQCSNPCEKKYDCKQHTQGISPGCRDTYEASYDCQWIDVTDVAQGTYTLRVTVNPIVDGVRAVPELSYTNNVVECSVRISVTSAEAHKCWAK